MRVVAYRNSINAGNRPDASGGKKGRGDYSAVEQAGYSFPVVDMQVIYVSSLQYGNAVRG